jgi:hypothetical protein
MKTTIAISAIPVTKKLPYMHITNIPDELIEDVKNKRKANHRYYIVKINKWEVD